MVLDEDSENICFICGIEKFNFEKSGIDFDKHTKVEHNLWSYVDFLIFMREKTEKDCNGIEDELFHKIQKGDTSWFPLERSISYGKISFVLWNLRKTFLQKKLRNWRKLEIWIPSANMAKKREIIPGISWIFWRLSSVYKFFFC